MTFRSLTLNVVMMVILTACAPSSPAAGRSAPGDASSSAAAPAAEPAADPSKKTITVGVTGAFTAFSAPADRTLIMVWKEPYYLANAVGTAQNSLSPLPRHVLEAPYATGNVDAFEKLPYWNQQFFHVGPYRPVRFEPQVELVLQSV